MSVALIDRCQKCGCGVDLPEFPDSRTVRLKTGKLALLCTDCFDEIRAQLLGKLARPVNA